MADSPYYQDEFITLYHGDARQVLPSLPAGIAQSCITSPPYFGLRNYGVDGQIGLEETPQQFVANMVEVFTGVRRLLRPDGTLFLNLGDSYAGYWGDKKAAAENRPSAADGNGFSMNSRPKFHACFDDTGIKPKDLIGIPWRTAFALQDAGWWLRSDIPWVKRSAMPESVTDRPAKALEYFFMLTSSAKYFCDMEAIRMGVTASSLARWSQDIESQVGSDRVPGKTNGNMKAVGNRDRSLPTNRNGITGSLDDTPTGSRNFRNADLWFQSVGEPYGLVGTGDEIVGIDINPGGFKESHFATFPPKLIEPFVKCGTSQKGQCSVCGSAWIRNTQVVKAPRRQVSSDYAEHANGQSQGNLTTQRWDEPDTRTTVGWKPSCSCGSGVEPQTIIEPFAGAATTLIVAKKLGRKAIGIELSEEYCEMAARRIERETAMSLLDLLN